MVGLLVRESPLTVYPPTHPRQSAKGSSVFPRGVLEAETSTTGFRAKVGSARIGRLWQFGALMNTALGDKCAGLRERRRNELGNCDF